MNDIEATNDVHRTPIIKLWDMLLVPLQGEVSDRQAQMLTDEVLRRIQQTGVRGLVIDLSGMWAVDSHLCSVVAKLSSSAGLMGTRTVLSGMSADVALTLQTMGIELSGIESTLGLEEAIELLMGVSFTVADQREVNDEMLDSLLNEASAKTTNGKVKEKQ